MTLGVSHNVTFSVSVEYSFVIIIIIIINVKIIVTLSQKLLQGHCTKRYVKICS